MLLLQHAYVNSTHIYIVVQKQQIQSNSKLQLSIPKDDRPPDYKWAEGK